VQDDSIKTRVESAPGVCNQRSKLKRDEPLSNVAFNVNVRRYIKVGTVTIILEIPQSGVNSNPVAGSETKQVNEDEVGRCRLTLTKTVLNAPMASALETNM
jgi:hypothetical protein